MKNAVYVFFALLSLYKDFFKHSRLHSGFKLEPAQSFQPCRRVAWQRVALVGSLRLAPRRPFWSR